MGWFGKKKVVAAEPVLDVPMSEFGGTLKTPRENGWAMLNFLRDYCRRRGYRFEVETQKGPVFWVSLFTIVCPNAERDILKKDMDMWAEANKPVGW